MVFLVLTVTIIGMLYFSYVLYRIMLSSYLPIEGLPDNVAAGLYMSHYIGELFCYENMSFGLLLVAILKWNDAARMYRKKIAIGYFEYLTNCVEKGLCQLTLLFYFLLYFKKRFLGKFAYSKNKYIILTCRQRREKV